MARKKYNLPYGDGSFYYSTSSRRWVGTIEAGTSSRGTRRRITVSSRDKDTAWSKLQAKRKEIMIDGLTPEGVRAGASVESWITEWLTMRIRTVRPKTAATEQSLMRRWVIPTLGRVKLEALSPAHMRTLTSHMIDSGCSTTTARTTQRVLQQALKAAIVEGHQVPQRALLAAKPSEAVSARQAIPLDDAIRLLQHAQQGDDAARWVAALLQGMRQGEVLGLTWECVDLDAGTLDVSWQLQQLRYADRGRGTFQTPDAYEAIQIEGALHLVRPKTRSGYRVIPLVPWMLHALAATPVEERHGLVFKRVDWGPRRPKDDREAWKRLQEDAGVAKPDGTPYVLHEARHTTATLLLAAGVDPEVIKAIMGHSDIVTTRGYQHASQAMARAALEKVAGSLQLDA